MDDEFILFWIQGGLIWWLFLTHQWQSSEQKTKNKTYVQWCSGHKKGLPWLRIRIKDSKRSIKLPSIFQWPCSSLPVYALVSKLNRLLHMEIKPSDVLINCHLDGWLSYLDERLPRGVLCQVLLQRWGVQQRWSSRSPCGHSNYSMHQTNLRELLHKDQSVEGMQREKGKHTPYNCWFSWG